MDDRIIDTSLHLSFLLFRVYCELVVKKAGLRGIRVRNIGAPRHARF
jgi:hypothetical protein